jgi:hypothetical protein
MATFDVGRAIFASIENENWSRKNFLRFEFNRRIAGAGVSESLVCIETLRRKFRRAA